MAQVQRVSLSITTPLGPDKLLLRSCSGEERLSGLYQFQLAMQSEDRELNFSKIVGKQATVEILLEDSEPRYISGIVTRFVQGDRDQHFSTYHAELCPWLWFLTLNRDCRIFQEKTLPAIIMEIFADAGQSDFRDALTGSYESREYCVQYNETSFAFVSRLMEEAGIFYYFEHENGRHVMVLADDPLSLETCPGAATAEYGSYDLHAMQNVVTQCTLEESVIAKSFDVDDFYFETPSTDLSIKLDSGAAQDGPKREIFEYPAGFRKKNEGEAVVKRRVEEEESKKLILRGDCRSPAFLAGKKFTLTNHYNSAIDGDYMLMSVHHSATVEGYSNTFVAQPATAPYRPSRVTPRPSVAGTQTAIVVGKAGEEIWTDEYGRIKVQFHWDRLGKLDEKSSCWIRVAQDWAGKGWGFVFLPRIGHEVLVTFEEGNPDRPIVTGAVYNAEQTVPYRLPDEQTKSTVKSRSSKGGDGYNELRFEDKKDAEQVYFQAERDFDRLVKNNDTLKVGFDKKDAGDQTIDIYNNRTTTLDQGHDLLTVKKGNRDVILNEGNHTRLIKQGDRTIQVETGKELHEVAGTRTVKVTKAEDHTNEDSFLQKVTKDYTLKVDGNLLIDVTGSVTIKSAKSVTIEAGQGVTVKAGTTLMNQAGTALTNEAGTSLTNTAGTTMDNEAGTILTNKGTASQKVDGGGSLTLKGGMIKIN